MGAHVHPLVLAGYGLVEAPFSQVAEQLAFTSVPNRSALSVERLVSDAAAPLDYLRVRTHPATRLVLVDLDGWTGVLTNGRNGSDFNDHQHWIARSLHVRTIRVVDTEARWWTRDGDRERLAYEARIVEVLDAGARPVRSIACVDDGGRWTFDASGTPFRIESSFDYGARRTRDRFTRDNLRALLREIGPGPLTADRLLAAPRFALAQERMLDDAWQARLDGSACTLEEADDPAYAYFTRGLGWVPHMATHASSVVVDLERAVRLDAAYEKRARPYLEEARRVLGARRGA